jgi:hypothetical protein
VARERVFGAIATLDGLRLWRTTIMTAPRRVRFGFTGPAEQIVMRADEVRPLSAVAWPCLAHTRDGE